MNEPTQTPPPLSDVRNWWIAWTVAVIGGPVLAVFAAASNGIGEGSGAMGLVVGLVAVVAFIAHIVASIGLARRIARRRDPDTGAGTIIGLSLALIVGGWAVKAAIFFVGCLAVLSVK